MRYADLLSCSQALAAQLAPALPARRDTAHAGPRVAIHAEPGFAYVAATWAAWMAGGVAVPLATSHPPRELDYVLRDSGASAVLAPAGAAAARLQDVAAGAGARLHVMEPGLFSAAFEPPSGQQQRQQQQDGDGASAAERLASHAAAGPRSGGGRTGAGADGDGALIIYTSGTTGRPKGALHTHG